MRRAGRQVGRRAGIEARKHTVSLPASQSASQSARQSVHAPPVSLPVSACSTCQSMHAPSVSACSVSQCMLRQSARQSISPSVSACSARNGPDGMIGSRDGPDGHGWQQGEARVRCKHPGIPPPAGLAARPHTQTEATARTPDYGPCTGPT